MSMIDRIIESYITKDNSEGKRVLRQGEIDAFVELISKYSKYFIYDENDLRKTLGEVVIIPKEFFVEKVPFFTIKEEVKKFRETFKSYPYIITDIEIRTICALLSEDPFVLYDYMGGVNKRIVAFDEIDQEIKKQFKKDGIDVYHEKFSYKTSYFTKHDLENAEEHYQYLCDQWDYEDDKSYGYSSKRFDDIERDLRKQQYETYFIKKYLERDLGEFKVLNICDLLKSSPSYKRELYTEEDIRAAEYRRDQINNELEHMKKYREEHPKVNNDKREK